MLTEPAVHILEVGMIMDGFIFLSELDCFSGLRCLILLPYRRLGLGLLM